VRVVLLVLIITMMGIEAPAVAQDAIDIPINPMIELDFMTKAQVLALRRKYIAAYPGLAPSDYKPQEAVFGQITDNRPWWGILGISYYGNGKSSIEGPSEESRFICNPYLLVGLTEVNAHIVRGSSLAARPIYPVPVSLTWYGRKSAQATYDTGEYWRLQREYRYSDAGKKDFYISAYNARDLGFNYIFIDQDRSRNLILAKPMADPGPITQFIHCGGSCGYPQGCNNMSPHQDELLIAVKAVPALVHFKLWRKQPKNARAQADMDFAIVIK